MLSWIKKKLSLIDDIIVDQLRDLKSLRYLLVLGGFALNIWIIKQIVCCGLHYSISIAAIGLLTAVYTMYFASKHNQAQMENKRGTSASEEDAGSAN